MNTDREEDRRRRRATAGPFAVQPKEVRPARDIDACERRLDSCEKRLDALEAMHGPGNRVGMSHTR